MNKLVFGVVVATVSLASAWPALSDPYRACENVLRTPDGVAIIRCLQPLAQAGDPEAEFLLGEHYGVTNEPTYDAEKSAAWIKKAAVDGQIEAQVRTGDVYRDGVGVPKNLAEAIKWYRVAADRGDQTAQFDMGLMYYKGWGTPRDVSQALTWEQKAAEQEGPMTSLAEASVAHIYLNGDGVPQDYARALRWFRKAAERGDPAAWLSLAQIDERGLAGSPDLPEAYIGYSIALNWLSSSHALGPTSTAVAKRRDEVVAKLTESQKADADRIVAEHGSAAR